MTYYVKGGSRYNSANPKVWVGLFLGGFPDADSIDPSWDDFADKGHETNQDPFWRMGGSVGGAKEFELGLWNDFRLKFETTGITYWDGDSWEDLLAEGGAENLGELSDVVITDVADNELLAWDAGSSKWINQTPAEAGLATTGDLHAEVHILATTGPHTGTLPWNDLNKTGSNLTDLVTRNHNDLLNLNAGDAYEHITQAQKDELHVINPHTLTEIAEPSTPAADTLKLYAFDESGFTTLRFIEPTGKVIIIGECMYKIGRNTSGSEIARGKLVSFNGTTTGKHPNFSLAKADSLTTMPVIGITCDIVANNGWARLMIIGRFDGLDTYNYENGDVLYASATTAGEMTDTFPPSPLIDQQVGIVEVKHAVTGVVLINLSVMQGRNDGTILQSFQIGDGVSGDVTLAFNGDAGNDGSIVWDVSEDKFVFNYPINGYYNSGEVDGLLHSEVHVLATTGPHTGTLPWADLNKTGSSLADLITRTHANLSDAPTDAHHPQSHDNTYHTTNYKIDFSENTAFNKDFGTVVTTVCQGNDTRLSDSRTPVNHANEAHNPDFCVNNDSRLSDARTPTAHAMDSVTYHTRTDIATLDASTSFHGFLKKLDGTATNYMNGSGNWSVPAVGSHDHDGDTLRHDAVDSSGSFSITSLGGVTIISGGGITFTLGGASSMDQALGMGSNKITSLADGTVATDAMAFGQKYTLEQHNNSFHSTNYHTETDGTGVVTVHSDITSVGSGAIITVGERADLHSDVVTTNAHVQALSINAVSEDSSPSLGGNLTLAGGYRIIGPSVSDYYIWSISSAYLTYGLYYNTGTPDYLEIKWAGATTLAIDMETGNITTVGTVDGVNVSDLKTAFDALDYYTQAEVNGLLHPQAHTLASHTTKAHSELSDAPASAHHVKYTNANAVAAIEADDTIYTKVEVDALEWVEADITDLDKYTVAEVDAIEDRFDEQSAVFPVAPVEGDLHYDEDDDSLYRYNGEAEAWVEVGTMGAIASESDRQVQLPTWGGFVEMTRDGTYYDVDLSGTYGAFVLGVLLYIVTSDNGTGQVVNLRPKGSSDMVYQMHQVAGVSTTGMLFVHTDSDGIFQYMAQAGLTAAHYKIMMVIQE